MKKHTGTLIILGLLVLLSTGFSVKTFAKPNDALLDSFDAEFYVAAYPDVAAAFGTDEAKLYAHYVNYGKKEGRFPNAQAAAAAIASKGGAKTPAPAAKPAEQTKKPAANASFFAPGDENYLRVAYMAQWGTYEIGKKDEWGEGDPAVGFTRQDYTQNQLYQDTKADILAATAGRTDYIVTQLPHAFMVNNATDEAFYRNLSKNLCVDLMKEGKISNLQLWLVAADGDLHLNTYGIPHAFILLANDHALDKADIAAHPEIKGYYNKGCLSGD